MATLKELLAKRSPESRARIDRRAGEMRREVELNQATKHRKTHRD